MIQKSVLVILVLFGLWTHQGRAEDDWVGPWLNIPSSAVHQANGQPQYIAPNFDPQSLSRLLKREQTSRIRLLKRTEMLPENEEFYDPAVESEEEVKRSPSSMVRLMRRGARLRLMRRADQDIEGKRATESTSSRYMRLRGL